jgi:hypothetical protein
MGYTGSSGARRLPPAWLRVLTMAVLVVVAFVGLRHAYGSPHGARVAAGPDRWQGGVVRFYNAATDQQWAVNAAVAAWNGSGASVRFVPVREGEADLAIRDFATGCRAGAEATLGRVAHASIWLPRLDPSSPACNQFSVAMFAAHELGHVLGLTHQLSGCAAMNPAANFRGPALCPRAPAGSWWCALLEQVDVARAVRLYGGTALARPQQFCPLYPAPAAPAGLTASAVPGGVSFGFVRPPDFPIPSFVGIGTAGEDSFSSAFTRGDCDTPGGARYRWGVPPGATMTVTYRASAGSYCFAVSASDRTGQRGPAATYRVTLP